MSLAIVTPSFINSPMRVQFARKSLASLENAIGTSFLHVVVDDVPRCGTGAISSRVPNLKLYGKAESIYNRTNIALIRRFGRGSASAILQAVREARKQGAHLVFIHLDDNVYIPLLEALLEYARDAVEHDEELMEVRLSGYPVLSNACTPQLGNRTQINIADDRVSFDNVCLRPIRYKDYTLWWSYFHDNMVDGRYWPIAMWSTMYRAEFLERLLTFDAVSERQGLNEVELYYKDKDNWRRSLRWFSGKLGYVNMQFGGLEMQRNKNWRQLIHLPNIAVR